MMEVKKGVDVVAAGSFGSVLRLKGKRVPHHYADALRAR